MAVADSAAACERSPPATPTTSPRQTRPAPAAPPPARRDLCNRLGPLAASLGPALNEVRSTTSSAGFPVGATPSWSVWAATARKGHHPLPPHQPSALVACRQRCHAGRRHVGKPVSRRTGPPPAGVVRVQRGAADTALPAVAVRAARRCRWTPPRRRLLAHRRIPPLPPATPRRCGACPGGKPGTVGSPHRPAPHRLASPGVASTDVDWERIEPPRPDRLRLISELLAAGDTVRTS